MAKSYNPVITQTKRLNPEPLIHCKEKGGKKCTYPVCHCYDHDRITADEANQLLLLNVVPMLERLRIFIDDLKELIAGRHCYCSREQLRVYRKRKIRLQKNFNFWKKRYDQIMGIQK